MISCYKYFITIILFFLFFSTLVTACVDDGEGSSEDHASNIEVLPYLGPNRCFEEMKRLTGKNIPEAEDMAKVAIRDWTSYDRMIMIPDLKFYYKQMENKLDFDAIQSPSEWCGENAIRLGEETFGSVEENQEEEKKTPTEDPEPSASSGWFGRIFKKRKKEEPEPYLTDTEKCEIIAANMKARAAKEDQMDNCLGRLREFGETKEKALLVAFNDRTLNYFIHSRLEWDINFRYKYMEYLMNNVKFKPGLPSPHDFCYRDIYYYMDSRDERKKQYLKRKNRSQNQS